MSRDIIEPPGFFLWRKNLIVNKISGNLPSASWKTIFKNLPPPYFTTYNSFDPIKVESDYSETENGLVLWNTIFGKFWGYESEKEFVQIMTFEQNDNIYQQGPVKIKNGDVVIDVGGFLGVFTRIGIDRGASKVVVIEPEQGNIKCLKKTFATEINSGQVILIDSAVWSKKGELEFTGKSAVFHVKSKLEQDKATIRIPATTIDAIAEDLGLDHVDFIKMDIEGSERYALAGAQQVLAKYGPRLAIAAYHTSEDSIVLPEIIQKARPSYRKYIIPRRHEFLYYY
ncbi:MAG TPA: FkbM family methyltransferase [Spirochaetota bacterium]|nr:FkbM family methyltransferase [Spirochaetota bacterium]HOD16539.1 FkbM family methyltransferase [Spirochaetota bacterium]HPG52034.1 FkbM family methyltransferase [Spirochaetota bacterium]HPN13033.1 FkbM family methyltransferase [Spirochaetota bacterium]